MHISMILLFVLLMVAVTFAHLNIFISQAEVMKLLGLSAELFYVREGVVNTYAMNFVVPVPAHINELEFSWQSLAKNPLPYVMAIEYDNPQALRPPEVNVTSKGTIPTKVQTFRVRFPCTGLISAEVDVLMQINVSAYNPLHNETSLNFRRNKICLKEEPSPRNASVRLETGILGPGGGTLYIAVFSAIALILVLVAATSALLVRRKKTQHDNIQYVSSGSAGSGGGGGGSGKSASGGGHLMLRFHSLAPSMRSGSYATIASFQKVPVPPSSGGGHSPVPCPYATTRVIPDSPGFTSTYHGVEGASIASSKTHVYSKPASYTTPSRVSYYASSNVTHLSHITLHDPRVCDPSDRLRDLAIPRKTIILGGLIHEGTFGRIYRGTWHDIEQDREFDVVVKTVSDQASKYQVSLLLAEGTMMYGLTHKHVLSILAVNIDSPKQPYLIYPFINNGNLKRFLQNCRVRGVAGCQESFTLLTQDIVDMAVQITLALIFLHSQRICHKDIATRTCVVDEKLRVKITDNALSRDLFPTDYYCLGDNENRPIKWLALESLQQKQFTAASDVWSLGVLLWELTTLAQQPYLEVDPFEMAAFLRDGYRLAQPVNCPDELFALMACCWAAIPEERPLLSQLLTCLQEFYTALGRYI